MAEVISQFKSKAVCTVITADYFHYALTLNESILAHSVDAIPFYVLDVHSKLEASVLPGPLPENVVIVHLADLLKESEMARKLQATYAQEDRGMLRWALKSVLMEWVLERHETCLYLDNDLCFYDDFSFLWEALEESQILLTPHWRVIEPEFNDPVVKRNIELTYMHGLYNAGFIGVGRKALDFLRWWSRCCLSYQELRHHTGIYVDQTFLNVVPLNFEGVRILEHRGCNVSAWNFHVCKRSRDAQGRIWINEKYPLVFTHFAWGYEQTFERGEDLLIEPLWRGWKERLLFWEVYSRPYRSELKISFLLRVKQSLSWRLLSLFDRSLGLAGLQRKR